MGPESVAQLLLTLGSAAAENAACEKPSTAATASTTPRPIETNLAIKRARGVVVAIWLLLRGAPLLGRDLLVSRLSGNRGPTTSAPRSHAAVHLQAYMAEAPGRGRGLSESVDGWLGQLGRCASQWNWTPSTVDASSMPACESVTLTTRACGLVLAGSVKLAPEVPQVLPRAPSGPV